MKKGVRRQTGQRAWDPQPPCFRARRKLQASLSHQVQNGQGCNRPVVVHSFDSDPIVYWDERDFQGQNPPDGGKPQPLHSPVTLGGVVHSLTVTLGGVHSLTVVSSLVPGRSTSLGGVREKMRPRQVSPCQCLVRTRRSANGFLSALLLYLGRERRTSCKTTN